MAQAGASRHAPSPWSDRFFEAAPVSPAWAGAAIALALIGLFLALVVATGELAQFMESDTRWWQSREGRIGILLALLAAYLPTARRYARVGALRNLGELGAALGWQPGELDAARGYLDRVDRRGLRLAGALGVLCVPLTGLLVDRNPALYLQSEYWGAATGWAILVGAFAGWNGAILIHRILVWGRRFSELGRRLPEIDLFDLAPLAPLTRQGLHSALPGLIVLSFFALNVLDRGFLWAIGVMGMLSLAAAGAAVMLPVRGVHERVREEKRRELARIDAAIKGDVTALGASAIRHRANAVGLADLLAYRNFVYSVREWPFDAPTRTRLLLYAAIPIGSWLGGAFVERLLDAALP